MTRQEAKLVAEAIAETIATVRGCNVVDGYGPKWCCVSGGRPENAVRMVATAIANKLEAIGRPITADIIRTEMEDK